MSEKIIIALIGSITTIAVAFISPIISRIMEKNRLSKITPEPKIDRREALFGAWIGCFSQETGNPEFIGEHPTEILFREEKGLIAGELTLRVGKLSQDIKAHLLNVVFDGFHFKADYVNKSSTVSHFGTIFGNLSSNGLSISGPFIGYGLHSDQFVSGKIKLEKRRAI